MDDSVKNIRLTTGKYMTFVTTLERTLHIAQSSTRKQSNNIPMWGWLPIEELRYRFI